MISANIVESKTPEKLASIFYMEICNLYLPTHLSSIYIGIHIPVYVYIYIHTYVKLSILNTLSDSPPALHLIRIYILFLWEWQVSDWWGKQASSMEMRKGVVCCSLRQNPSFLRKPQPSLLLPSLITWAPPPGNLLYWKTTESTS